MLTPDFIFESDDDTVKDFKSLYILANDLSTRDGEICRKLADCYNYGNGVEKDISQAVMWYGISADQYNDSMASYRLGQIYLYGHNEIEIDKDLGNYYCKQAFYLFRNEIKNFEFFYNLEEGQTELSYYTKVSREDAYKEYLLGRMYLNGEGIEQDKFKAYQAYELAESHGCTHSEIEYRIGLSYLNGTNTKNNTDKAIKWLEKSMLNGNQFASYKLGVIYSNGTEIPINIEKSLLCYQISSELGNPDADYQLGYIYQSDKYGVQNNELSIKHFTSALSAYQKLFHSEPTNSDIAMRIGTFYHYGLGVEHDIEKALSWYKKSVELGNEKAKLKISEAQQMQQISIMAVASTACHLGRIINTETVAAIKNRYVSDSKLLRKEKIQKIQSGHAINDSGQSYDY